MAFGLTNAPGVDSAELEQIRRTAENAVPKTTTVNGKPLTGNISLTHADVGAVPVTRTVNGKALGSDISLTPSDVGAVPVTRKVNGKVLSGDISLTAADVGAAASGHSHTFFVAQAAAPGDKTVLWIDTTAKTGGLKYFNGSAWVPVPVIYV